MGSQGAGAANPLGQSRGKHALHGSLASALDDISGVRAQTLIEPNSKPKLSQPSGTAKSELARRTKSCSAFGAGFVQIPGTDTCVKIGGYISTEGTVNRARWSHSKAPSTHEGIFAPSVGLTDQALSEMTLD